jgi:hypothetical protein
MELFALSDREPGRLLAVTDADEHLSCGDLGAASEALARAIGGTCWSFSCVRTTPALCWVYLGCLRCGMFRCCWTLTLLPGF